MNSIAQGWANTLHAAARKNLVIAAFALISPYELDDPMRGGNPLSQRGVTYRSGRYLRAALYANGVRYR